MKRLRSPRMVLFLASGLLALVSSAHAQDGKQPLADLTLPTNPQAERSLQQAERAATNQAWDQAITRLQAVLDARDGFVRIRPQDDHGQPSAEWRTLRGEGNRRLAQLPARARKLYEQKYGPTAKARLAAIKSPPDLSELRTLDRYFHTTAGWQALKRLGRLASEHGDVFLASAAYGRLLHDDRASGLSPSELYAMALVCRKADDSAALRAWTLLASKVDNAGLRVGPRLIGLAELKKTIDETKPAFPSTSDTMPYWGGRPDRSGKQHGGLPKIGHNRWSRPLVYRRSDADLVDRDTTARVSAWLRLAVRLQEKRTQPIMSGSFPIAAAVRVDNQVKHLLVYRSYWGIHAVDVHTGALEWESPIYHSLELLLANPAQLPTMQRWRSRYTNDAPEALYGNSMLGTLSTDGSRVYVIADLALAPHPSDTNSPMWRLRPTFGEDLDNALTNNGLLNRSSQKGKWGRSLTCLPTGRPATCPTFPFAGSYLAFDLESGKIVWSLGRMDNDKSDLQQSFFLGPPLPLGGKLYVLNEKKNQPRLLCLDAAKQGALLWSRVLANVKTGLEEDASRRLQAAPLAYADGVLVCPTHAGAVFGTDLLGQRLWVYPYQRLAMKRKGLALPFRWQPTAPIIQAGSVVLTTPDADELICLDLHTGRLLWQHERKDNLYLAGVFDGRVLLVGQTDCQALDLTSGRQLWQATTGQPSGQGAASGQYYYLPLRSGARSHHPEVCQLELATGKIVASAQATHKPKPGATTVIPGNLLLFQNTVISQTITEIAAYP